MNKWGRGERLWRGSRARALLVLVVWTGASGCLGPKAVRYTRMRYNEVVRDTNDEQLLINIVRLRYADSPVFIDLPNITSQFEMAGRGNYLGGYGNQYPGPDEPRVRRAVAPRHADPELPPARGARDRQVAADAAVVRPVHRGQRRGRHRAAPVADHQRHQRRAERARATTLTPKVPDDNSRIPPRHPAARVAPGTRRHRAGVRDERRDRRRVRPDPQELGPGARPAERRPGRLRLPRQGRGPGDLAQAGKGPLPPDSRPLTSTPPRWQEVARIFHLTPGLRLYQIKSELTEEANRELPEPAGKRHDLHEPAVRPADHDLPLQGRLRPRGARASRGSRR